MAIVAVLILCSCSKKEIVNPSSKPMIQKYYTQEGKPYVLKTITKFVNPIINVAPAIFKPFIMVNIPQFNSAGFINGHSLETEKKIIPLNLTFSVSGVAGANSIDITTPYYYLVRGYIPNYRSLEPLNCLSKLLPLITQVYVTDVNHCSYTTMYGQAVFSETDFISPVGGLQLVFEYNQGNALANTSGPPSTLAIGNYSSAITFTYFELE